MEEKLRVYTHTCMHLTRPYVDLMVKAVVGIYCDPCRRQRLRELWPMGVWRAASTLSTPANYGENTMSGLPACRSGAFSTPASHAEYGVRVR
jgi:hypothetical protein